MAMIKPTIKYRQPSDTEKNRMYHNMKKRCSPEYQETHPSYKDCEMCDEWKNDKYEFYKWVDNNYYVIVGEKTMHLDHDILVKGNKIYSPETCVFCPPSINNLIASTHSKSDNGLPVGVERTKSGKFKLNNRTKGVYDTPEQAFEIYRTLKRVRILELAYKYEKMIPEKLYNALINYQIEIDD